MKTRQDKTRQDILKGNLKKKHPKIYNFLRTINRFRHYLIFRIKVEIKSRNHTANGIDNQKHIWSNLLRSDDWNYKNNFAWGSMANNAEIVFQYQQIKDEVTKCVKPDFTVLELGSYDGMWTQYFTTAKKIICVDLFENGFPLIQKRLDCENLDFYCTQGNELHGIKSDSVDLIFSIDSLMRADKKDIKSYFVEFNRVLKKGGTIFVHLPSTSHTASLALNFTLVGIGEIKKMCRQNFSQYSIHRKMLPHGVIVKAVK